MAEHHCAYCQNAILTCRIKCVECKDFDLCLQCFALGVEVGSHKKEHDYQALPLALEEGEFVVFCDSNGWTAVEENSLLDAVEQYGFGNWEDVANSVKSRTAKECSDHYYAFYIHGSVGKATYSMPEDRPPKVIEHTGPEGGPLSPSLSFTQPSLELSLLEQHELGYMPLRDDFEREYDNGAETLVSSLAVIGNEDEDIDVAFKFAQVDMYRQRLKERLRRKRIAREYGVIQNATSIGIKKVQADKKKQSRDERDLKEKMKVFAQFHSVREHDQFFNSLQKEKRLKSRIKELMRYRRNGITKLTEGTDYDTERLKREKKKENKKKMGSSGSMKRTQMGTKREKENEEEDITIGERQSPKKSKDADSFPGFDILTDRERKLCRSIALKPASYITIKTCIIKDYLQRRQGVPVKFRYPTHLDKTHRRKILNFLNENGWIGGVGGI